MTDATFDAFLWQTVEKKQRFISQIVTSKSPVRSFEDVDETALSYAEIKALCAGDPRIKERMELDVEVSRLKILEAGHKGRQYELENRVLSEYPREIKRLEQSIQGLESDAALRDAHPSPEKGFAGMEVLGRRYTEREAAGAALLEACRAARYTENMELGSYRGFGIAAEWDAFSQETRLILRGKGSYYLDMGESAGGMIPRPFRLPPPGFPPAGRPAQARIRSGQIPGYPGPFRPDPAGGPAPGDAGIFPPAPPPGGKACPAPPGRFPGPGGRLPACAVHCPDPC